MEFSQTVSNATLHSLADSSVLSFDSGFTDAWSVSSARRRRLCHGVEAFEGAVKGLGIIMQHDTNSSSTSSELARAGHTTTAGIKRKAEDVSTNSGKVSEGDEKGSKSKSAERSTNECSLSPKSLKASSKLQPEYPKQDFIHVRARRGQATDSHSLAERVRREKISERMKFLQDLVPGCSKVTGKAVMLDEIINYVQSLQRQIEFLSMKLAAVDPQLDIHLSESLLHKELAAQARLPDPSAGYREYQQMQQLQTNNCNMDAYRRSSMNNNFTPVQLAPLAYANSFVDPLTQTLNRVVYDGDLQSIVHMGNTQASRQEFFAQGRLHGPGLLSPGFLKVEY